MKAIIGPILKNSGGDFGFHIGFDTQEEAQKIKRTIHPFLLVYPCDVEVGHSTYDKEEK